MTDTSTFTSTFEQLGLQPKLLSALRELGYESPTQIQQESIPVLLAGRDLVAQAQTGTGKTAAFALPALTNIDITLKTPQVLVIAPTRELAIQVAEAMQSYARHIPGFHVAPIYGGQDYQVQLRALSRGTHVIVGTPGRLMDHMRRGSLRTNTIKLLVLDEADEMLKMGFIDDITWILEQIPEKHQTALFSATMPLPIQKIAQRYLRDPEEILITSKETSVAAIEQFYTIVPGKQKLDVLTRFLEIEEIQAAIIFARTKSAVDELAQKLQARGYTAAALHGDMNQAARKNVLARVKSGALDMLVATDVAARGIDVERISHVINYDIPFDTESYIHRIGRTGRAGRTGKAFLFVTERERYLLKVIERAIHKPIKFIEPPTTAEIAERRRAQLVARVTGVLTRSKKLQPHYDFVAHMVAAGEYKAEDIAAALVCLMQQSQATTVDDFTYEKSPFEESSPRPKHNRSRSKPGQPFQHGRPDSRSGKPSGKPPSRSGGSSRDGGKPPSRSGSSSSEAGKPKARPGGSNSSTGKPRKPYNKDKR